MFKMQGLVPWVAFVNLLLKGWTKAGTFVPVRPHLMVEHVFKSSVFESISNFRKCKWKFRKTKNWILESKHYKTALKPSESKLVSELVRYKYPTTVNFLILICEILLALEQNELHYGYRIEETRCIQVFYSVFSGLYSQIRHRKMALFLLWDLDTSIMKCLKEA